MSISEDWGLSSSGKKGKLTTALSSPRRPAGWCTGELAGWRGARVVGQQEAVEGL